MIELCRRGNVRIQFAIAADQHRITLYSLGPQQRGKQRVLVLAVAVSILQNVRGRVRLIAPDSERNAHVTHIPRHKIVEPPRLLAGRLRPLGELVGFFSHAVFHRHALALQLRIPLRNLLPVGEGGQLHIRTGFFVDLIIFVALRSNVLYYPGVSTAVAIVLNLRLARRRLEFRLACLWDVNLQPVFIDHHALRKGGFVPEISRSERRENPRHRAVFQRVPRLQRSHGNMPLPVVAVHGSFSQHVGSEILRR